jgi:hypothetical protein
MGLDIIGMIMDIEDEFAVAIDDRDASSIETVGGLFDHVVQSLHRNPARKTMPFASARCFYDVRRALRADRAVRPVRVRPDTTLEELAGPDHRGDVAKRLTRTLHLPDVPSRFVARTGTREPAPGLPVRDVVASYVRQVPLRFIRGGEVDTTAVWNGLCEIVAKYAGGEPESIKRETHLVRDLRLG